MGVVLLLCALRQAALLLDLLRDFEGAREREREIFWIA
jgi:hypothetical protein